MKRITDQFAVQRNPGQTKRQTVLSGEIDVDGYPNFLRSIGVS